MQNIFLDILITKTNILIYISYNKSVKIRSSFKFKMFVNNQFESREANPYIGMQKKIESLYSSSEFSNGIYNFVNFGNPVLLGIYVRDLSTYQLSRFLPL